jgi:hypothetical protein
MGIPQNRQTPRDDSSTTFIHSGSKKKPKKQSRTCGTETETLPVLVEERQDSTRRPDFLQNTALKQ